MNKVFLIGRLGADPEKRFTPGGAATCAVSLATSSRSKNKQTGERTEYTEWHRLVLWNRLAEIVAEFCRKGSQVSIVGELRTRSWEKDGQTHYITEVLVRELELLGSRGDGGQGGRGSAAGQPAATTGPASVPARDNFDDFDDDIPF